MLNSLYQSGSVTATGVICQIGVEDCQIPVGAGVGGTFVGTVLVEITYDNPGVVVSPTWIAFGSAITAPGTAKIDIPVRAVRLRCSAFTSGTIVAGLGAMTGSI